MPIQQDNSALPRPVKLAGLRPDSHPRFGPLPARAWQQDYIASGGDFRPMSSDGADWRHSWAGTCARALSYRISRYWELRAVMTDPTSYADGKLPEGTTEHTNPLELIDLLTADAQARIAEHVVTDPLTIANHWTFNLGQLVHDQVQSIVERVYDDAKREVKVNVTSRTGGAGSIDLVVQLPEQDELRHYDDGDSIAVHPARKVSIEIKTINGFGFKRMIGDRGEPEGPRTSSVIQSCLNADAIDADEAVLIVLSLECLSPAVFQKMMSALHQPATMDQEWRRFLAEYTFDRDTIKAVAEAEHKRVRRIVELTAEGKLVPRAIPDPAIPPGARITDPKKGIWQQRTAEGAILGSGTTWHCNYCENRERCVTDGMS